MIKKSLLILISLLILLSCANKATAPLESEEVLVEKYGIDISQKDIEIRKQIEQKLKAYFEEKGSYALIFTGTPQENYDPDKNVLGRAIAFSVDELGLKNVTIDIDLRNINFINGTIVEDIFSFAIISNPGSVFFNYIFPEDKITTIGIYSFRNNNVIKEVVIPDSVTTLEEGIFYYNSSLEKVTLGKGIKTIGFNAFADCELLKEVDTSRCSSLETI
ncbi:leucine-rich repeat domain-containing protein [Brachyspira intermedia]|uniref:leucine-rich repeat domain-containing protein n=1 Tax=Brachyspira intermedia TaxID=84377 RepID=UPI0030049490